MNKSLEVKLIKTAFQLKEASNLGISPFMLYNAVKGQLPLIGNKYPIVRKAIKARDYADDYLTNGVLNKHQFSSSKDNNVLYQ